MKRDDNRDQNRNGNRNNSRHYGRSANRHEDQNADRGEQDGRANGRAAGKSTHVWLFSFQIGLFAGIIWGAVKVAGSYFKFTKIPIHFMAKPFMLPAFYQSRAGFWIGWLTFIGFSIVAAWLYALLLRHIRGPWAGLLYGAGWWALIYTAIGPATGMMRSVMRLDWNTIVTDALLFIVWGLFIGYSISFEFTDERQREPASSLQ